MKKIYILFALFTIHCSLFTAMAQQGQWTWMNGTDTLNSLGHFGTQGVFDPANSPPALFEASEWTDLQGNFWLYGGDDYIDEWYADLWEFKPSINQWAWIKGPGIPGQYPVYGTQGVPSPTNNPGQRWYSPTWVDSTGNLWLFGGADIPLSDLWKYDIASNEWTWLKGPTTSIIAGVYGTITVPNSANNPGARTVNNTSWTDSNNNLWLFGGFNTVGFYNDLWKYSIATNEWTWMKGPNTYSLMQPGVYGTIEIPNPSNLPGGRYGDSKWKDKNDNLWLFAGANRINQNGGYYNDLWKYSITTNNWTWINGDNIQNDSVSIGSLCDTSINNKPCARAMNRACWQLDSVNFASFGGCFSNSFAQHNSYYNDMWDYNITTNEWVLMSGSIVANQPNVYGIKTITNPTNHPGGRMGSLGWKDTNGYLWVFGGWYTSFPDTNGFYNDLWRFIPDCTCPVIGTPVQVTSHFTASPLSGCDSITVTFNNTSINSTLFTWSFGDNTFSTATNPTHTFTNPGTYTVKLVANASCSIHPDSSTITINVYPSPLPIISGSMLCDSMPSLLDAGTFVSYNWSTGSTTETITVTTPNTYTVTVTNANGCTGTASRLITVNPNPIPPINGGDSLCAGDSLMLFTGFYSHYIWSNGDTTSINFITTAGTYFVTVTDANGCTGVDSITITVNPLPIPVITASGPITFCQGDSVTLTTLTFPNYHWSNNATTQSITVNTSGTYIVTVTTAFGCTATTSQTVTVIPLTSVTSAFHSDTTKGCTPLTINFINTSINGTSYLWNFGDNTTDTAKNPTHTYLDSGSYSIKLIVTNVSPCGTVKDSITLIDYISVNVFKPVASFTSDYTIPIYVGDSIHFKDGSYDPTSGYITLWQWWFGDGKGSNFLNPIHAWDLPGMYQVTLIVTNNQGCKDSTIYDYIDVIEGIIDIPNTFSPNNDGYNDFFEIRTSGIENLNLQIFNRWGILLFESKSNQILWDGYTQSGLQCPDGTYFYVLKATAYSGKDFSRAGFIMLLR